MSQSKGPDHSVQEMDRQIFDLVNQVRQRPQDMIPHLQQMEQRFDGMMYKQQGKTTVRTKEGVQAVREASASCTRCTRTGVLGSGV